MNTTLALALLALTPHDGAHRLQEPPPVVPEDPGASWDGRSTVAHEWGTFTSVMGSDGVTLSGLAHEERDLPSFVYDIREFAALTGASPKMETPVIYFYSPEPWRVRVDVSFPRGVITQWYPGATRVNHGTDRRVTQADLLPRIHELEGGFVRWGKGFELLVLGPEEEAEPLAVAEDDPWRFTREVHANWLSVCNPNLPKSRDEELDAESAREVERFLFYRGLGDFELPLAARVYREELSADSCEVELELVNLVPDEPLRHLFLVRVHDGKAGWTRLPDLTTPVDCGRLSLELRDFAESTDELVGALTDALARTGLYLDEAYSMARTWQEGYFQDEGLRVLYVLPAELVERELPLSIRGQREPFKHSGRAPRNPAEEPESVVRTFVGRTELISPEREAELERVARDWALGTEPERAAAWSEISRWGRFATPYLERVLELSVSDEVRVEVSGLLAALREWPDTRRREDDAVAHGDR